MVKTTEAYLITDLLANKRVINYFSNRNCAEIVLELCLEALTAIVLLWEHKKRMLRPVHPCLRSMCDICVFTQRYAYMSKDLRHLIVTEYPPHAYTYFCHTLEFLWLQSWAPTEMQRRDTRGDVYRGHMWPGLVPGEHGSTTLVLSVRRPVGQLGFREKPGGERRHAAREGAPPQGSKTSIPSSQSQSTEALKWCRIFQEACRVEPGERGPNVTLRTLRSVPVNYHRWHGDLESWYWTEMTILLV